MIKKYTRRFLYSLFICLTALVSLNIHASTVLKGQGYDQHVELNWSENAQQSATYHIYVSISGGEWQHRQTTTESTIIDFIGEEGNNLSLRYKLHKLSNNELVELDTIALNTRTFSDEELLEMVQRYTFRYFWNFADDATGWAKERIPDNGRALVTSGGTGFGIMSIITASERAWITREQAVNHLLKITLSLSTVERFHGMWGHWYENEVLVPFSRYDDGGDIVESAFMAQGLLTARQYFDGDNASERQLREEITQLWHDMEWSWYSKNERRPNEHVLTWHWSKNYAWRMNHAVKGYNEALIAYVLAAASPSYPINAQVYHKGWAWGFEENFTFRNLNEYYGIALPLGNAKKMGGPLFFSHYSYLGLNPKGLRDRYANYWQQNKRQTLINRAYAIDNPLAWKGYGEDFWGITAGDKVPSGYTARSPGKHDLGTISPTAALSSMPYTPAESMAVLKNLYYKHGKEAFGLLGFYDGINLSKSNDPAMQVRKTYLAIDQGPIVVMIENYRSSLLWDHFMKDPDVKRGLKKLDFTINGNLPD